jgi:hypothetical protein
MIEVVPLDRCRRWNHFQKFHWLDASQGVRTAAVAAAIGYSFANSLVVEDERDLLAEA